MRGFRVLRALVYLQIALMFIPHSQPSGGGEVAGDFLIYWKGRYWFVDESGQLIRTASPRDGAQRVVYGCVDLNGMRVKKDHMDFIKNYDKVLNREEVSEVCVSGKYVIFRKGVVVYFHRWEDLAEGLDTIVEQLPKAVPGSVFELFRGGDLLVLKGGWRWPDMRYTHP